MIYRLFPTPLDQIFLMAYRLLFLTLSMTGAIFKAVRSRGGGIIHSIRVQGRIFAEVFALVFIRSFDRAERVHQAMIARGYNGKFEAGTKIPRTRASSGVLCYQCCLWLRDCIYCPYYAEYRRAGVMTFIRRDPHAPHCPPVDKQRETIHVDCASHTYPDGSVGIHDMCFYVHQERDRGTLRAEWLGQVHAP
ncbi:MAG: energy-coupling factor transporter transmembrane protein EcfT [Bacillus subtilis]|nr:energy-coupling factor transporter transmembrane protein EcfT [Bacillus subtilis]